MNERKLIEMINKTFGVNQLYYNSLKCCIEMQIGGLEENKSILEYEIEKIDNPSLQEEEKKRQEKEAKELEEELDLEAFLFDNLNLLDDLVENLNEDDFTFKIPSREEIVRNIKEIEESLIQWTKLYELYMTNPEKYNRIFDIEPHTIYDCPNYYEESN